MSKETLFSPWELETMFHVFSNLVISEGGKNPKFGKKYELIANKAINQRAKICPESHNDSKLWA